MRAGVVLLRILFGRPPDRAGIASSPALALAGAFLTGLGFLVFPATGIEMVRRIPPHLGSTAMGGFGPTTNLPAAHRGHGVVFLAGGLAASPGPALVIAIVREDRQQNARPCSSAAGFDP